MASNSQSIIEVLQHCENEYKTEGRKKLSDCCSAIKDTLGRMTKLKALWKKKVTKGTATQKELEKVAAEISKSTEKKYVTMCACSKHGGRSRSVMQKVGDGGTHAVMKTVYNRACLPDPK